MPVRAFRPTVLTATALLVALPIGGAPARAQTPVPQYPTNVAPQPSLGSGLTLRPAPVIRQDTYHLPDFVMQGGQLTLIGTFAAHELVVWLGSPPLFLEIVERHAPPAGSPYSRAVVRFPAGLTSPGAALQARHGTTGASTVIKPALKVLAMPSIMGFRPVGSVTINVDESAAYTERTPSPFEVSLSNFDPSVLGSPGNVHSWPVLHFPGCTNAGTYATRHIPGSPHRLLFENVAFMLDAAGRNCLARVLPYGSDGGAVDVGYVQLPPVATYTIENTRVLLEQSTSSGKRLQASASKGGLPCQLLSVGSAGTFNTGVVIDGDDLTFQLRNGALTEQCEFKTTPRLEVKSDWAVQEVVWDIGKTSLCQGQEFGMNASNAPVSFFNDGRSVFPVIFQAWCNVNKDDLPRNSHVYKARLKRIVLVGPPGKSWKDAFK